jgi:hypothetical protein
MTSDTLPQPTTNCLDQRPTSWIYTFNCLFPQELAAMERHILKALDYDLARPTAINFLDHLLQVL